MHVCFLLQEYPRPGYPHGGIGSFVKTIAGELVRNGLRVSVIGMNYTSENDFSEENGVHIYRLKKSNVKGLSWWLHQRRINSKIREIHALHEIDVIETSELGMAFLNKIRGIKYVIRLHGGHHFFSEAENRGIDAWKGFQEKKSFAKADAFVAVSEYVKTHTAKYLSYHNKNVALISYPIDTELFRPLSVPVIPGRLVFAGTVCEKKGVRQLIQSFAIVKQQFPAATIEIYGRDWYYPDGSSYIKMLEQTELPKLGEAAQSVFFHGAIPHIQIPFKYAEAEVCVFPSHMETQGLVAPEAMVMQKTVVFSKLGPGPETISHGETGLLCDPYNPQDIAQNIIWAFEHKTEVAQMQKNGAEAARKKYGLDEITDQNIAFYQSLVG